MKLHDYMRDKGLNDLAMAELIGRCSAKAVEKWKYGHRFPRPEHLRRIAEATDGAVTAQDFLEPLIAEVAA